jgi:hypothetical protein
LGVGVPRLLRATAKVHDWSTPHASWVPERRGGAGREKAGWGGGGASAGGAGRARRRPWGRGQARGRGGGARRAAIARA